MKTQKAPQAQTPPKKTAKKILIIEDDISLSDVLRDTLLRDGFVLFQAEDGEEGLALALKEHPDLILLDLVLPKKDGMRVLIELRDDPWGKAAKVIILSNQSDTKKVAEAMMHETFDYLVKSSVDIGMIVTMVKKNLGMGRGE
ncbi:MAG TPA: response regulator [Candidatus Paceibacterota bacterium]